MRGIRISTMWRSFLAGAGLSALIDSLLMLPLSASDRLPREYTLLTVGGTLLASLLFLIVVELLTRVPPLRAQRPRIVERGAFLPGLVFGAMPMLMTLLPAGLAESIWNLPSLVGVPLWSAPALLLLLLPLPQLPRLGERSPLTWALALTAPVYAVVVMFTQPSAVPNEAPPAPAYPDANRKLVLGPAAPGAQLPDLVLVSIDTLRTDLVRDGKSVLPSLEALRNEGLWHAEGYSTSNQTVPGHFGMLTGLEPDQHKIGQNVDQVLLPIFAVEKANPFLAQRLLDAGYRTAGVVSNAMADPFAYGYQSWDNTRATYGARFYFMRSAGRATWLTRLINPRRAQNELARWLKVEDRDLLPPGMSRYATDSALRYHTAMASAAPEHPLHLFVHYMDAHSPYTAPESTAGRFASADSLPPAFQQWAEDHRILINRVRQGLERDGKAREVSLQAADIMRAWYDEEILALDADLQRLVDGLRASGRPTLLVVTSDHGEHFGEHNLMEHSNSLYQELVRVPFVMVGLNGVDVPVAELPGPPSVIDVMPTMLSAAGLAYRPRSSAQGLKGSNLLDAEERELLGNRMLLASWRSNRGGDLVAVTTPRHKLLAQILPPDLDVEGALPSVEVVAAYDLDADPSESVDLLQTNDFDVSALRQRVDQLLEGWMGQEYWDRTFELTPELRQLLEELGYAVPD